MVAQQKVQEPLKRFSEFQVAGTLKILSVVPLPTVKQLSLTIMIIIINIMSAGCLAVGEATFIANFC